MAGFDFIPADDMVDVSAGLGIPFDGIGTGYSVYGKFGFVNINFDSAPDMAQTGQYPRGGLWRYDAAPQDVPPFAFIVKEGSRRLVLQEASPPWLPEAECAGAIRAFVRMPKGWFMIECPGWEAGVTIEAFSPMVPHSLADSTVPAQVYTIALKNLSCRTRTFQICLVSREETEDDDGIAICRDAGGEIAIACADGRAAARSVERDVPSGRGKAS